MFFFYILIQFNARTVNGSFKKFQVRTINENSSLYATNVAVKCCSFLPGHQLGVLNF